MVTVSIYTQIRATSQQDISRSRLWFFEGKKKILLYSERSHFYHRYKVKTKPGALLVILHSSCYFCVSFLGYSSLFLNMQIRGTNHLLIYSLPGRKEFYPEVLTNCHSICVVSSFMVKVWNLMPFGFVPSFQLVNMLGESENPKCNVLFSRLDLLKVSCCFT